MASAWARQWSGLINEVANHLIDIQRPPEKKNAQACDKLIDTGAIITNSGLYAPGAGRVHPVIVGRSTRNRPLLPRPINDTF
jgi:hypothetical protein